MNLKKLIATNNKCYIVGKTMPQVEMLMLHSTGAPNKKLSRYVGPDDGELGVNSYNNHWNTYKPSGLSVCVHGFIGELANGEIATYQILPWDMEAWGCGYPANGFCIQIEICESDHEDTEYALKAYNEAVEVFAYLCKMFNLEADDIICHSEAYKAGIATNHSDVMHWFPKFGKSMDTFRADVSELLEVPHWAEIYLESLVKKGIIETPVAWEDFDEFPTKGQMLALIDKATGGTQTTNGNTEG